MPEHYQIITVTHRDLNTKDLEHFMVRHDDRTELQSQLFAARQKMQQAELIYLSTCNRVIFFFYGAKKLDHLDAKALFASINPDFTKVAGAGSNLKQLIKIHRGADAIRHIYEVAASIDSLVVGEREIFRQFRQAYSDCHQMGLCGDGLRMAQQSIVKAAKDVYTNTKIGAKPVSVVSLAVQEFRRYNIPTDNRILLLGSGETNSSVGRFLKKYGYNNIVIFNRSLDNAKKLSGELGAEAKHLAELSDYREPFDCIFACTAAQAPILTSSIYQQINDGSGKKLIIDLAIPNNVSETVARLSHVNYVNIDEIRDLAKENLLIRSGNIAAARIILNGHLAEFKQSIKRRALERAFGQLPEEINKVRDRAINKVYRDQIEAMPADAQRLIMEITEYMSKKCVAIPMKMAKASV